MVLSILIDLHGSSKTLWLHGLDILLAKCNSKMNHDNQALADLHPNCGIYEQDGWVPGSRYHRRCMSTCTADGKAQPHRRCMTPSACYVVFLSSHRRWMLSHRRCMSCSGVACDIHCHSVALGSVRVSMYVCYLCRYLCIYALMCLCTLQASAITNDVCFVA